MKKNSWVIGKSIFFAAVLFFMTAPAFCQDLSEEEVFEVDESVPILPDKDKWAIVELSGISSSGNSESGSLLFGTDLFYKMDENWVRFAGGTYYSESSQKVEARIMEGYLRGGHDLNDRHYVFFYGMLKHDLYEKLDLRSSLGAAYGFSLIKASYEEFAIEGGIGLQSEDFDSDVSERYPEGRFAIHYLFRFSESASFETNTEYLPSFKKSKDYRVRSEFRLTETLYRGLGMRVSLVLDYDGSPIDNEVDRLDSRVYGGVTYSFF